MSSDICGQQRPKSACVSAQSDQDLPCPLTESLNTTECMNGEQRPGRYFAHVQDDLNLRILCVLKRHFFTSRSLYGFDVGFFPLFHYGSMLLHQIRIV